jgi:hypothetical protein
LGGNGVFDVEYLKALEEKLQQLKEDSASKRIRNVRMWAIQELLSDNMTSEKLQSLIDTYQAKVDSESEYNVGNHEPLLLFKEVKEHLNEGKRHHVIRPRNKGREDIEKPLGDLSLELKGDNPMELKVGDTFVDP